YLVCLAPVGADDPGDKSTIEYVQKLATKNGAFQAQASKKGGKGGPTLAATAAAGRTLHLLKGTLPDPDATAKYVTSCYIPISGGFGARARTKADVTSTALALMALKDLDMPVDRFKAGTMKFLAENVKTFDEIRMAAAGLEGIRATSFKNQE